MNITLSYDEIIKFIKNYGIEVYENCPCGSGKKYKWCCKQNIQKCTTTGDIKKVYHQLKAQVWNRRRWRSQTCHWGNCTSPTQHCHSIQNNRFLNQICDTKKRVHHFIPMGKLGKESIELKDEPISLASTFNGFCNTHDRELFAIIERENILTFTPVQKYVLAFRNFCYMLSKQEIIQQTVIATSLRSTPKYYQKDFIPRDSLEAQISVGLIVDLRKTQIIYEELGEIIDSIESNYDSENHQWNIISDTLLCSNVRTLDIQNSNFCFQTVREYLCEDEVTQIYKNPTIDVFKDKRYAHISTIVLPENTQGKINVFFALSSKCKVNSAKNFLDYVNTCSEKELVCILNNIIFHAYEELYVSKSNYFDLLSRDEQIYLQKTLTSTTYLSNHTTFLKDIFLDPQFEFIKLRDNV